MRKQQYACKREADTSVLSAKKLLKTRPFQPEHHSHQPVSQRSDGSEFLTNSWDLTKARYVYSPQPNSALGQPLQTKLAISERNDQYEQDAEQVGQRLNAPSLARSQTSNQLQPSQIGAHTLTPNATLQPNSQLTLNPQAQLNQAQRDRIDLISPPHHRLNPINPVSSSSSSLKAGILIQRQLTKIDPKLSGKKKGVSQWTELAQLVDQYNQNESQTLSREEAISQLERLAEIQILLNKGKWDQLKETKLTKSRKVSKKQAAIQLKQEIAKEKQLLMSKVSNRPKVNPLNFESNQKVPSQKKKNRRFDFNANQLKLSFPESQNLEEERKTNIESSGGENQPNFKKNRNFKFDVNELNKMLKEPKSEETTEQSNINDNLALFNQRYQVGRRRRRNKPKTTTQTKSPFGKKQVENIRKQFKVGKDLFYGLAFAREKYMGVIAPIEPDKESQGMKSGFELHAPTVDTAQGRFRLPPDKAPLIIDTLSNTFMGTGVLGDALGPLFFGKSIPKKLKRRVEETNVYEGEYEDEDPRTKQFREFLENHQKYNPYKNPTASEADKNLRIGRSSKGGIEFTLKNGGKVHFILDGDPRDMKKTDMLDIDRILADLEKDKSERGITGKELRWTFRHWDEVKAKILFWKNGEQCLAPWEQDPKTWEPYRQTLEQRKQNK